MKSSVISITHESAEGSILTFLGFRDKADGSTDTDIQVDDPFLAEALADMSPDESSTFISELVDKAHAKQDGYRLLIEIDS